jgi:hypothetical protein
MVNASTQQQQQQQQQQQSVLSVRGFPLSCKVVVSSDIAIFVLFYFV